MKQREAQEEGLRQGRPPHRVRKTPNRVRTWGGRESEVSGFTFQAMKSSRGFCPMLRTADWFGSMKIVFIPSSPSHCSCSGCRLQPSRIQAAGYRSTSTRTDSVSHSVSWCETHVTSWTILMGSGSPAALISYEFLHVCFLHTGKAKPAFYWNLLTLLSDMM